MFDLPVAKIVLLGKDIVVISLSDKGVANLNESMKFPSFPIW